MSNITNLSLDGINYTLGSNNIEFTVQDIQKLVPENIKNGVVLFEGTDNEVVGSLTYLDLIPNTDIDLFDGKNINPLMGTFIPISGGSDELPYIRNGHLILSPPTKISGGNLAVGIQASENYINIENFDELELEYGGSTGSAQATEVGYIDDSGTYVKFKSSPSPFVLGSYKDSAIINLRNLTGLIRVAVKMARFPDDNVTYLYFTRITLKRYNEL